MAHLPRVPCIQRASLGELGQSLCTPERIPSQSQITAGW